MEYILKGMFGEKSLTKVVGLFANKKEADAAATNVLKAQGMFGGQALGGLNVTAIDQYQMNQLGRESEGRDDLAD